MDDTKQEKLKKILKKAVDIKKNSDLAIAREFIDLDEKLSDIEKGVSDINVSFDKKLSDLSEELKKKLESELVLEIDREELKGDKGVKGDKGDKGDTQIVEKIVEKREIVKELPIIYKNVTNEIKEVAKYEDRKQIVDKINTGGKEKINASEIKGLPEFTREVVREVGSVGHIETPLKAGANISITTDGSGAKVISSAGGDLSNIAIQFPYKTTSAYKVYTYDGSNRITRVDYYSDVGLTQYIFSKETDWSSYPTTVTTLITDRVTNKTRLIITNLTGGLVTDSSDIIT